MTSPAPSAPRKTPPPPPRTSAAPAAQAVAPVRTVQFCKIAPRQARRVGIYGPGGSGKTSLAASAPGPVAYIDLDDALPVLADLHGMDIRPIPVSNWQELVAAINARDGWDDIKTIVIDPLTKVEELGVAETIATVPHEKGSPIKRLEDYGFGKGLQHVYDTFLPLLGALDVHVRAGRNIVVVMHDCTRNVPNPAGEDWIRYEPRLQDPPSGKGSIRLRVKEWLDDLLFLGYDVNVTKDGKGQGCGTRTIYPVELPFCMAKSRKLTDPMPIEKGSTLLWTTLFAKGA